MLTAPMTWLATIQAAFGFAEPVASLSHFLGALVALLAGSSLLKRAGDDRLRRRVLMLFTAALVVQLTASGFYHRMPLGTPARELARRVDHAVIPILIGGCFLPLWLFLLRGRRIGTPLLVLVVAGSAFGVLLETVFFTVIPRYVAVLLYVIFSSIGTPIAVWLVATRGLRETLPFFLCGCSFSLAAIVQLPRELILVPGVIEFHEVVHLLLLNGLVLHWTFVARLTNAASVADASRATLAGDPLRPAPVASGTPAAE